MKIKQLSALLLIVSMAAVQSVSSKVETEDQVAVTQTESEASGKTVNTKVKKERTDKVRSVKAKDRASKKKAKTAKGKRVVKKDSKSSKGLKAKKDASVAKLGKFDRKGEINSFTSASTRVIELMNDTSKTLTVAEKSEIFRVISRFNWITGRKNFDTPAHYEATLNLLRVAAEHPEIFGETKMKFITKWTESQENPVKKDVKKEKKSSAKKVKKAEKSKFATTKRAERRAEQQAKRERVAAE